MGHGTCLVLLGQVGVLTRHGVPVAQHQLHDSNLCQWAAQALSLASPRTGIKFVRLQLDSVRIHDAITQCLVFHGLYMGES